MGAALFDRIVVVDWSANSTPKTGRDSIWIGVCERESGSVNSVNIATRSAAVEALVELVEAPGRCLIGVDFSLGYPTGTARALGLTGRAQHETWSLLSREIRDDERNANNRFEVASELNETISGDAGPFWGCHPSKQTAYLTSKQSSCAPLPQWRTVETVLREQGHRPFSSWQLLGAGAVGSQSLVGIPALAALIAQVEDPIEIWPFSKGLAVPTSRVVISEVWPTLVESPAPEDGGVEERVRDQVQVETLARHLVERGDDLAAAFSPVVPPGTEQIIEDEEGWVLGA